LQARGDRVIAAARRLDQLADLIALGCTGVAMDVGDDASVRTAFASLPALDAVVHCAAVAPAGTVEFTAPAQVAQVFNINTLGALRIIQGALPLLRQAPSGRLVLVSSLWGQVAGPFVSAYAASKHAIEALADSARRETIGQGVYISVIEPGVVKTPMYANQIAELDAAVAALGADERRLYCSLYQDHRKILAGAGKGAITAEQCCAVIERCLDARPPRPRYRAGTDAKLLVSLDRVLGDRLLDRIFGALYRAPLGN
jgi:NAD(P)-dependent dehydrogenase (short-subunit alcohol dehydrogenase family)